MPHFWEKNQTEINILLTRDENKAFGEIHRAMYRMGYNITEPHILFDTLLLPDPTENKKIISLFSSLKNTLAQGRIKQIPEFFKKKVDYFKEQLITTDVHGLFIPPTPTSTMPANMIVKFDSNFEHIKTGEESYWRYLLVNYNELIRECCMILAARSLEIPVFGSCHGAQLLWYMHGGDLYSLPDFTTTFRGALRRGQKEISTDLTKFRVDSGCILNTHHKMGTTYATALDTVARDYEGYESDEGEEAYKDYYHNLLMVTNEDAWPAFNAKKHPNMEGGDTFIFPPLKDHERSSQSSLVLEKGKIVARSFEFDGCIATQWHPHKNVDTKSSIRYLHELGTQCLHYKEKKERPPLAPKIAP